MICMGVYGLRFTYYKITNRNIITNKIKIFRGHGVTKENMNPLIITISPLNKMDIWVTIGVDVTGTDPMRLIRIIVCQTGIPAATPLIRPGVLEERKVIVKELQTRFQKSWDTVQIVNKKGMQ